MKHGDVKVGIVVVEHDKRRPIHKTVIRHWGECVTLCRQGQPVEQGKVVTVSRLCRRYSIVKEVPNGQVQEAGSTATPVV